MRYYIQLQEFYEKHQFLIGPRSPDLASQVDSFLAGLGFGTEDYQIGTTKVRVYGMLA